MRTRVTGRLLFGNGTRVFKPGDNEGTRLEGDDEEVSKVGSM